MNRDKLISIGKGALIAVVGALLTYGTSAIANIDFGSSTAFVVAGWSVLVNIVRKSIPSASDSPSA